MRVNSPGGYLSGGDPTFLFIWQHEYTHYNMVIGILSNSNTSHCSENVSMLRKELHAFWKYMKG
jgi:hypothetical protein